MSNNGPDRTHIEEHVEAILDDPQTPGEREAAERFFQEAEITREQWHAPTKEPAVDGRIGDLLTALSDALVAELTADRPPRDTVREQMAFLLEQVPASDVPEDAASDAPLSDTADSTGGAALQRAETAADVTASTSKPADDDESMTDTLEEDGELTLLDAEIDPATNATHTGKKLYAMRPGRVGQEQGLMSALEQLSAREELDISVHLPVEPPPKKGRDENGKPVREKAAFEKYLFVLADDSAILEIREARKTHLSKFTVQILPVDNAHETIERLRRQYGASQIEAAVKPEPKYRKGDRMVVTEGSFEGLEGAITDIHISMDGVEYTVMIQVFSEQTSPVRIREDDLEPSQS